MDKLLYTGLKVTIPNVEQHIHTSLVESYNRKGYLFITKIDYMKDIVYVSYAPKGYIIEPVKVEYIEPIYDRDLFDVIQERSHDIYILETELRLIRMTIEQKLNLTR